MDFLVWYFATAWREVFKGWRNFLGFWWYFFSVPWLLRTLLAPWHRDVTPYGRGFDIGEFAAALGQNLVSRVLGFAVRLGALVFWFGAEVFTLGGGAVLALLWPLLIIFVAFSLLLGVYAVLRTNVVLALAIIAPAAGLGLLFLRAFGHRRRLALVGLSAEALAREHPQLWLKIVRRLGLPDAPPDFFERQGEYFSALSIGAEDFAKVLAYERDKELYQERSHRFWDEANLFAIPPLGRSWVFGYTVNLDRVGRELMAPGKPSHPGLVEYGREVKQIETILSRTREANALIVGEPGVGREAALEIFSRELAAGRLANVISHKRLVELLPDAVAGVADFGHILAEAAYAGNVILILPALENYVKYAEVLVPQLGSPALQIIAFTSYEALHETLERYREILTRFEKVEVKEPDLAMTAHILLDALEGLERRTGAMCPYPALKAIVERSDRYIQDAPFPKKALDLLDRVLTAAAERGETLVTLALVDAVVSEKTEIPVGKPEAEEKELLLNLEARLHERLVNQEEAVRQIADALRRARADIRAADRPVGTFLFLGPTGVGKTETAKALARLYYGRESAMVRLDMSEFQEVAAISRFIGDIATNTPGVLTTAIRENPASLVLLDEIEKAHPNILNLFLQVLDDARLTDAWGRTVKFTSCFIICTSNAGSEFIRQKAAAGSDSAILRTELIDTLQREGVFRPEFLNRFDGIVVFRTLNEAELQQIALLLLGDLAGRLKEKHITFLPTPELAQEVVRKGYHPEFGARPMRRVIQDAIEAALAKKILSGALASGATIAPKSFEELTA